MSLSHDSFDLNEATSSILSILKIIEGKLRQDGLASFANEIGKISVQLISVILESCDELPGNGANLNAADSSSMPARMLAEQQQQARPSDGHGPNTGSVSQQLVRVQPNGQMAAPQAESWARVAAIWQDPKYDGQQAVQRALPSASMSMPGFPLLGASSCATVHRHGQDNHNQPVAGRADTVMTPPMSQEVPMEPKAGVLRIRGATQNGFIQHVTRRIHEGPLYEIQIESNDSARLTFLHVAHALKFLEAHEGMVRLCGYGRLGRGYDVELAEVVDWNDDQLRMKEPYRERRRLTFARKELFNNRWTADMWMQDLRAIAGASNIDTMWVFNNGNATAVFTSTVVARRVHQTFEQWKDYHEGYIGVSCTYSSDPCEKELVLKDNNSNNACHPPRHHPRPDRSRGGNNNRPARAY